MELESALAHRLPFRIWRLNNKQFLIDLQERTHLHLPLGDVGVQRHLRLGRVMGSP